MGELQGTPTVDQREQIHWRWSQKDIVMYRNAREEEEKQAEDNKVHFKLEGSSDLQQSIAGVLCNMNDDYNPQVVHLSVYSLATLEAVTKACFEVQIMLLYRNSSLSLLTQNNEKFLGVKPNFLGESYRKAPLT